jgi:hypothetical protein
MVACAGQRCASYNTHIIQANTGELQVSLVCGGALLCFFTRLLDFCEFVSRQLHGLSIQKRSFALQVVPVVTAPQYFGTEGISWLDGLPSKWDSRLRYEYCPSSFGLVHGQRCNLCGAVVDLKLHSTICTIRCCTGRCVCLDSLVAKALLELPPAPSPVLRLPVWVVQSFLESWPSEPNDPNWLQHFFSVDQAFSTQISGLDVLLRERSQLLQAQLVIWHQCCVGRLQSLVLLLFVNCVVICSPPSVFRGGCFGGTGRHRWFARCVS